MSWDIGSLVAGICISSVGRRSSFLYGRSIASGRSIPVYLTYKDINIELQVHSGQSWHTSPGHELFSTHAKLAPLGAHPLFLSFSFMNLSLAAAVLVPRLLLFTSFIPVARLRIYSKVQPDIIKRQRVFSWQCRAFKLLRRAALRNSAISHSARCLLVWCQAHCVMSRIRYRFSRGHVTIITLLNEIRVDDERYTCV